jgi:WD40 repeat protein
MERGTGGEVFGYHAPMRMFQAHNLSRVNCLRFTPDARTLTVAIRRHTAVVHFDTAEGTTHAWEPTRHALVLACAYSADAGFVAVAAGNTVVSFRRTERVLSSAGVQPFRHFEFEHLSALRAEVRSWQRPSAMTLAFSPTPEPRTTRLGIAATEFTLWNPHTQEYIVAPDEGDYRGVSFGPDGLTVTSIEYHAHALCVWNVKPFRVLFRTDLKGIDAFDNGSVAMMPDGERVIVAAGSLLRCVPINGGTGWDTVTKKPPLEIALHQSGRTLLVADGSKKVTTYDTDNGKVSAQYDWGIGKVGCVTYSPDGTLAAAGGEKGQVVVWDAE